MPVDTNHPEYSRAIANWETSRDACDNLETKKAARKYLPVFIPNDEDRYTAYLVRAYYLNVSGRTRTALNGSIFRIDPLCELPPELDYMKQDADGCGQSLTQVAKRQCSELLTVGRYGLLTDYPQVEGRLSLEQQRAANIKASIVPYCAESIINWKVAKIGGVMVLTMVVLKEDREVVIDEYESKTEEVYRVLTLIEGVYTQLLYNKEGGLLEESQPRDKDGKTINRILFEFSGAIDNKPSVDLPPMLDIALVNIAHFRNSADFEENLFIHGQLTLGVTSNLDADTFAQSNPDGIKVGARSGYFLGETGSFVTATVPANTGLREAMKDKEGQMVSIGARLITPNNANMTVDAVKINASSETSALQTLTGNASEAMTRAIKNATVFMGGDPELVKFELNTDFYDSSLDPQQLMAMIQLNDRGIIAQSDVRANLRKNNLIAQDREDADIDEEIAALGFNFNDEPEVPFQKAVE